MRKQLFLTRAGNSVISGAVSQSFFSINKSISIQFLLTNPFIVWSFIMDDFDGTTDTEEPNVESSARELSDLENPDETEDSKDQKA